MATKKTIGGDRLGSGKKMTVDLHNYERSTHDLGYIWRSTMAAGTLVPFISELALPGDTFDIDLDAFGMTYPTVGPLFGSFKLQLDVFLVPIRLYQPQLHNNALGIGNKMAQVKLPQLRLVARTPDPSKNMDNQQINPSCIFSYLNIRGIGKEVLVGGQATGIVTRDFNAVPFLAYWDIYKNYYANKQEDLGAVIHLPPTNTDRTITTVTYRPIGLSGDSYPITEGGNTPTTYWLTPESTLSMAYTGIAPLLNSIMLKTYMTWGNSGRMQLMPIEEVYKDVVATGGVIIATNPIKNNVSLVGWEYKKGTDVVYNEPKVQLFNLENIDFMRNELLANVHSTAAYVIQEGAVPEPYNLPLKSSVDLGTYSKMSSQEGLALKTYQSDMFNNWMQTEWIDGENGINALTAIDVSEGYLQIDTLTLANKVYRLLNRIAISGGSYDDWQEAVYGSSRTRLATSPMYMGGLIREMTFQEVISNSSTELEGGQPLGTLGGRGVMSGKKKGGNVIIEAEEPSYIMGIVSLTPRIDYSQGNKWDMNLKTMNDFHKPELDEIGFQDLITDQMAWWDSSYTEVAGVNQWVFKSAGKQPAWLNYMTNVNQVRGNFADETDMFMVLNRRYENTPNGNIKDLTTYIDPVKFNHIFAETKRDAQNFWMQISVDITARRKMSAKIMPNL